jgi:hypothetical protein
VAHPPITLGSIVRGPTLPEPIEVLAVQPMGQSLKIIGRGRRSGQTYDGVSVETENRGFDLISRRPHPEDSKTFIEVRFIEVKGPAGVGVIALSDNEYRTAGRLNSDYWLYAVFNCASTRAVHLVQDPAQLGWEPIVKIEHYRVGAKAILEARTC